MLTRQDKWLLGAYFVEVIKKMDAISWRSPTAGCFTTHQVAPWQIFPKAAFTIT